MHFNTNAIKSNWTLEQLGWELSPKGDLSDWEGLIGWFVEHVEKNKEFLEAPYFKKWYVAALDVLN
jgi:hypothetical protein